MLLIRLAWVEQDAEKWSQECGLGAGDCSQRVALWCEGPPMPNETLGSAKRKHLLYSIACHTTNIIIQIRPFRISKFTQKRGQVVTT